MGGAAYPYPRPQARAPITCFESSLIAIKRNEHRSALRGTPGSACPQPEPKATELPSCAPISARAAQRRRRRRWWRGDEGARRPGPEGQVLRRVLWYALRSALRNCAASLACSSFTCRLGKAWGLWNMTRATMNTFTLPSPAPQAGWCSPCAAHLRPTKKRKTTKANALYP